MAESSKAGAKRKFEDASSGSSKKRPVPPWQKGLLDSMNDPLLRVDSDDTLVIIKDKYPKAKHHFLLIPKSNIPNLKSLKPEHAKVLEHMHKKGQELADKYDVQFRLGYHAVPSMSQLHLHVISQDFDSTCLKTKKHWNSFTTEYFVDSKDIIKMLKDKGSVSMDTSRFQEMLKKDLKCHVCKKDLPNMPSLKTHITKHSYT